MANTIHLKGQPIRKEGVATAIVKPGYFVVSRPRTATQNGSIGLPTAGAAAQGVILENELEGKTITDSYAIGDNVLYGVFPKGSEVLARVAAANPAIAAGVPLKVTATGTLALGVVGTDHIVAVSIEAVDNSAGGAEAWIQVEII
jgi:hypothetical protein